MPGRLVAACDSQTLVSVFGLARIEPQPPRWNLAPTQPVPVVYDSRDGGRVCEPMRWGLVPRWEKQLPTSAPLILARADSVVDKPSFRQALRRRRCIVPVSGFYEWTAASGADGKPYKQPHYISPSTAAVLALAGLFEAWKPADAPEDAEWLLSCCVITVTATAWMAPLHPRMPLLLAPEHWAGWLRRDIQDPAALAPLLAESGLPADALQAWPVARTVNHVGAEGASLIAPLAGVAVGPSVAPAATPGTA